MTTIFFDSDACNSTAGFPPQTLSTVGKIHQAETSPARALIDAARSGDQLRAQRILRRPDLPRIAMTLAEHAAGLRPLEPCGTRAAAERHLAHGEPLDDDCQRARRKFYRDWKRDQRATQRRDASTPLVYTDGLDIAPDVVRQWARDTGLNVGSRGRLRPDVIAAYHAAHLEPTDEEATG